MMPFYQVADRRVPASGSRVSWGHWAIKECRAAALYQGVGVTASNAHTMIGVENLRAGHFVSSSSFSTDTRATGPLGLSIRQNLGGAVHLNGDFSSAPMQPTDQCTVLYVRRKIDTTLRGVYHFGFGSGDLCNAHCPWSDGIVYWDYPNNGAGRLSWSGYSVNINQVEFWTFVAGSRGSAIYLNGVQRASDSTARTRTAGSGDLNCPSTFIGSGDKVEVYFFALLFTQWTPQQVRQWYQRPFEFMQQGPMVVFPGAVPAPSTNFFYRRRAG